MGRLSCLQTPCCKHGASGVQFGGGVVDMFSSFFIIGLSHSWTVQTYHISWFLCKTVGPIIDIDYCDSYSRYMVSSMKNLYYKDRFIIHCSLYRGL